MFCRIAYPVTRPISTGSATSTGPSEVLFRVTLSTGLRLGEVLALKWSDLDLDARTLQVRGSLRKRIGGWEIVTPKMERSRRTVTFSSSLIPVLRAHRARQLQDRLLMGEEWQDHDFVFANPTGGSIGRSTASERFKKLLKKAGLPHFRTSAFTISGNPARPICSRREWRHER